MLPKKALGLTLFVRVCSIMLCASCIAAVGLFVLIQYVNSANSTAMDNGPEKAQNK